MEDFTVWTINVQINSKWVKDYNFSGGNGTWGKPVGGELTTPWAENTSITITNGKDKPRVISGYTFDLEVKAKDTIRWVISEMNPLESEKFGVAMYGFYAGANWSDALTNPVAEERDLGLLSVVHRFNDPDGPTTGWLRINTGLKTFPTTRVIGRPKKTEITYFMLIALVDTKNVDVPNVLKYVRIDPKIRVG